MSAFSENVIKFLWGIKVNIFWNAAGFSMLLWQWSWNGNCMKTITLYRKIYDDKSLASSNFMQRYFIYLEYVN